MAKRPKTEGGSRKRTWVIENDVEDGLRPALDSFIALLTTCKVVRDEASEVFFCANTFNFPTTNAATQFLAQIGGPGLAIRSLAIERYARSSSKGFWLSLTPLINLKSVIIPHRQLCQVHRPPISLRVLQQHMRPLLDALRGARIARHQDPSLLELIRVEPDEDQCCRCVEVHRRDHRAKVFVDENYPRCDEACRARASTATHAKLVGRVKVLLAASPPDAQGVKKGNGPKAGSRAHGIRR